jgi:cytochrome c553
MDSDPIVDEIHAVRRVLSRASDDDIRKIAEAAKARQVESGAKTVRLPSRKAKAVRQAS